MIDFNQCYFYIFLLLINNLIVKSVLTPKKQKIVYKQ